MNDQQITDELQARGQINVQIGEYSIWSQEEGNPSLYNRWFVVSGLLRRIDSKMLPADVSGVPSPACWMYCGITPLEYFPSLFPSFSLN